MNVSLQTIAFHFSLIMVGVFIAWAVSSALPSDLIQTGSHPATISLSGVLPSSAKAIAATNENLTPWQDRFFADFGRYHSGIRGQQVNASSLTPSQKEFSEAEPVNLTNTSIGSANGNFTIINETLVWI